MDRLKEVLDKVRRAECGAAEADLILELAAQQQGNLLVSLWQSVVSFYRRFNVSPTLLSGRVNFIEESAELAKELTLALEEKKVTKELTTSRKERILSESADVIFTVMVVLQACGLEPQDLEKCLQAVIEKNAAKNTDSHAWDGSKIKRKS